MKLILAVVRDSDSDTIIQRVLSEGHRVTRLASTGGFLRRGNVTLMIGVDDGKESEVIQLMRDSVGPPDKEQHRVTIFVLNAIEFEQI